MSLEGNPPQLPTVLVVDDSLVERTMLVQMVAKWGYPVEVAAGGQEAMALIAEKKIQLVLADWQMPGMQGTELCVALRKLNLGQYTYLILMSAQNDEAFLIEALNAGADDVLAKPVDSNELEARLESAVRRIELQAEMARRTEELAHAHEVIAQDLRAVSSLQRSFLPEPSSHLQGLNYQWLSVPSKYVSGDHLHVFELLPKVYGFYLLDVSGHGIPAAVKSMQLVQMFADHSNSSIVFEAVSPRGARVVSKPSKVVGRLNRLFQQTESDLSYFTMIYGVFDSNTRHVSLCQAGHPSPMLLRGKTGVEVLGQGGYPVGLFEVDDFEDIELTLGPEDALVLYSDGVTEVMNAEGEIFGEDRLLQFVRKQSNLSRWANLPERIQTEVQRWGGPSVQQKGFEDDVSILMIAPKPGVLDLQPDTDPDRQLPELVFRLQEVQQAAAPQANATAAKSIVIVDDSRSFLRIFEAMLNSWGYTVHAARDGHEALALIERVQPDFVLTDWDMPGMSGIELCEQVRSQKQNAYTYIIMITGYASRDDLLHSLKVGADDFLTKPVNPSELKVRLKTAERIADLHMGLERRHEELTQLYEALQRDMREVSRIQRALLPKTKPEPWPIALQTLYQPKGYVCGLQMGMLETQANEYGFFMISMPGDDTATALQTMALARWFSMARATRVLFPIDTTSAKVRRYLASPDQVMAQLTEASPSLRSHEVRFDVLYGLINLDQGTLLVAGIGHWSLLLAQPGQEPYLRQIASEPPDPTSTEQDHVLYQGVITPGTRVYLYPGVSQNALGLYTKADWTTRVLLQERNGNVLQQEFARLLAPSAGGALPDELALLALQWREFFQAEQIQLPLSAVEQDAQLLRDISQSLDDSLTHHDAPLDMGAWRDCLAFEAVCDTVNIGVLSRGVRQFLENHGLDEHLCYNVDLAVSEALTNVMVHGFRNTRPKAARLHVHIFEQAVAVVLDDQGTRIPQTVLENLCKTTIFDREVALSDLPEGGMGLTFMRMVSQRFYYAPSADVAGQERLNRLALLIA
ncbi:response regulator [Limnobacter sp.]|uniref:response regulator n=1 Tax=Limnobacter sp. TaxID=2003368 RepID=UPI003515E334